jgi:hypothetical protein
MKLIETKTLGAATAEISFTSIPQDGTDLLVFASLRGDRAAAATSAFLKINTSTSNFTIRRLYGNGSSPVSDFLTSGAYGFVPTNTSTASTFGNNLFYFPNYTSSLNKSFSVDSVTENNAIQAFQTIAAGLWSQTAAITGLGFTLDTSNIIAGSTISLYKITKGSDGIVTTS